MTIFDVLSEKTTRSENFGELNRRPNEKPHPATHVDLKAAGGYYGRFR